MCYVFVLPDLILKIIITVCILYFVILFPDLKFNYEITIFSDKEVNFLF